MESAVNNGEGGFDEKAVTDPSRKVLVVGSTDSLGSTVSELRRANWSVDLASSPRLALESLKSRGYRVAIVELKRFSRAA